VRAQALHGAGLITETLGQLDKAIPAYEEALAIREALGDREGAARTLNNLANCAMDQGEYARAIFLHQRSLEHSRALDSPQGVGRSLAGLATVAIQQARLSDAEALFNEALPLLREVNDLYSVATIIANLGVLAVNTGDYPRARVAAEEAQQIWRVLGDPIGIANAVGNLGEIAFMEGDLEQARTLFLDALARYEEGGIQRTASLIHYNLGVIAELEGRSDDAWASYAAGLEGSIASDDRVGTTDFVAAIAGLHAAAGPEDAARWFGSARAERDRLGAAPNSRLLEDRVRQRSSLLANLEEEAFERLAGEGALLPIGDVIAAVRTVSARRRETAAPTTAAT
jgi:tetratricopeptide (TPR) repeat protein